MRVLLANKFFRPGAGAETAFFAERQLLSDAGHEIIDFGMRSSEDIPSDYAGYFAPERRYDGGGSPWRRVADAGASIYSMAARRAVGRLVADHRPDVAHLHNVYHQLTLSIVDELWRRRVPVVITLHDYKIVCPSYTLFTEGERCRRCVTGSTHHAVVHRCIKESRAASLVGAVETGLVRLRRTYDRASALVSPSHFLADLARQQVARDRVHVVPNFLPEVAEAGLYPSADERRPVVLFVGRLEAVKGIRPLLEAFATGPVAGLTLQIAGDGPMRAVVEGAAAGSAAIDYLGRVSRERVDELLRAATAMVLPSIWEENYPMSVIEARVAGTPVICSGSGGLPEMVSDGVDGLLIDGRSSASIRRAVELMAGDASRRDDMAGAGLARALSDNTPESHLRDLERVYAAASAARR